MRCNQHYHERTIPSSLSQLKNKWSFELYQTGRVSSSCHLCESQLTLLLQNEDETNSSKDIYEVSKSTTNSVNTSHDSLASHNSKICFNNMENVHHKEMNYPNTESKVEEVLDCIPTRIIQCLTCPVALCPKHFRLHEHRIGMEMNSMLYFCNCCGSYFKSLHMDAVKTIEALHAGHSYTKQISLNRYTQLLFNKCINQSQSSSIYPSGLNHLRGIENVERALITREKSPGKDDRNGESENISSSRRHHRSRNIVQNNETHSVYIRSNNGIEPFQFFLRGLVNMGNTCFMNAVLQALIHNPLLRNYILAFSVPLIHDQSERFDNFCNELRNDIQQLHKENVMIVNYNHEALPYQRVKNRYLKENDDCEDHPQIMSKGKKRSFVGTTPKRKRKRLQVNDKSNVLELDEFSIQFLKSLPSEQPELSMDILKKHTSIGIALQRLIQESYTPTEDPIIPHEFLYVIWKTADHLAGYRQQDAHEFLMAVLNGLESTSPYSSVPRLLFKGEMESRIYCTKCNYSSSTVDPFFDISLQMKSYSNGTEYSFTTLNECLGRFTRQELLGNEYKCPACHSQQTCSKRLTFKKMPPIICLHMKRFEAHTWHSNPSIGRRRGNEPSKIDDYLDFPLELDLFPYTSNHIHDKQSTEEFASLYGLFAVVEHFGGMNSGHYICYVKHDASWYRCDDEHVTISTETEVEQCRAYILFYVQKELEYE